MADAALSPTPEVRTIPQLERELSNLRTLAYAGGALISRLRASLPAVDFDCDPAGQCISEIEAVFQLIDAKAADAEDELHEQRAGAKLAA